MNRFLAWWTARAQRERTMLLVMAAAVGAFVYWYALLGPLRAWGEAARQRHDHAALELRSVIADARAIEALRRRRPTEATSPADAIATSARAAGIAIARHRQAADGTLMVDVDAAPAPALFGWLDALRREHDIGPVSLQIAKANGQLKAALGFADDAR